MDRRAFVIQGFVGASSLATARSEAAARRPASVVSKAFAEPLPYYPPDPKQFLTWDGGSGPNRAYWSQKLLLPWANPGIGDWLDARQIAQGSIPFASATVTGGSIALNVTDLVSRWLASGLNRGFYLRSTQVWPFEFAGRTHATVTARPRLQVVTDQGTTDVECSCNASWTPSSYLSKDSRKTFSVAQGNQFAGLQFDLSAITGTIHSAMLVLNCLSLKNPGTLEVFELHPPEFRIGKGEHKPQLGLANAYSYDRGIAAHPNVVFASDFSDLSKRRWQSGVVAAGSMQLTDPRTGLTQLRGLIPKGQLLGCDLERNLVKGTAAGITESVENELYARYYVLLEDNWGSEVDGNKMPGWDARLGWWNNVGYWQATTGNGGLRPTGLKVRNAAMNRWEYQGASIRGHGGTRTNDGNPYDHLFWIGSYVYHLDQPTNYGDSITWTGTVLGKGRWYCIEQYIKMNSIVGPFDANGNGVAVKDGHLKVWVDGVEAYERTDFRWRRNPEMGIQGFWLNWYHGGTAPSPRDMHFRMDSVVIARSYIGPRNESI